jgi:fumarate reductase subunit D
MPTIFDGYAKAEDGQIADQVALLETITLANAARPMGQKAGRAGVRAVKRVGKWFGRDVKLQEPEVTELPQQVEAARQQLIGKTRQQLAKALRGVLVSRSGAPPGASDEALAVQVVERASQFLKIDEHLTPAQKADAIFARMSERVLSQFQKELAGQDAGKTQETVQSFDQKIKDMDDEQRRNIQKILKVDSLTGETMRGALMQAGAPAAILTAVSAAGFGGFVALSTIIHAVFTTILGITLPFAVYTGASSALAFITGPVGWLLVLGIGSWQALRGSKRVDEEMLAQTVWFAVGSYGGRMTPPDEKLPSWVPQVERMAVERNDSEYAAVVAERDKLASDYEEQRQRLEKAEADLRHSRDDLTAEKEKRQTAERRRAELEAQQPRLRSQAEAAAARVTDLERQLKATAESAGEERAKLQTEITVARRELGQRTAEADGNKKEIDTQNQLIALASDEISQKDRRIASLETENTSLRSAKTAAEEQVKSAQSRADAKEEIRRAEIEVRWGIHFPRFVFRAEPLRAAARLRFAELCELERALRELHDSADPRTLSRGKLKETGNDHLGLRLSASAPGRVEYRVLPEGPNVEIIRVYRHGEKYMQ